MRLIEAIAASVIVHAAVLVAPTGRLMPDTPAPTDRHNPGLFVVLNHKSVIAAASAPTEYTATHSLESPEPAESGVAPQPVEFGIPIPYYYGPREVSERAKPIEDIALEMATDGTPTVNGKLILVLLINEGGAVDQVEIESSQLGADLEHVIVEQFRRALFSPAQRDGHAVKSRMKIEVVVRPPVAYRVSPPPPSTKPSSAKEN